MNALITGGAGFIGSNIAHNLAVRGYKIRVLDNFSRRGTVANAQWLLKTHPDNIRVIYADIRSDMKTLRDSLEGADVLFHMAAQVAVTTSLEDPKQDFDVNAVGTLNTLEALRAAAPRAVFIYASTNKVYGTLSAHPVVASDTRYAWTDLGGFDENEPVDYHTPYGCSKGVGELYTKDFHRLYGLRTVILRQSCIYGPRQFGIEDQGWVAWFIIAGLLNKPITIYGDGKQVRDLLYIDDLIVSYLKSIEKIDQVAGEMFNMGGGPENTLSLLELVYFLEQFWGKKLNITFSDWRTGDQRIVINDISKAKKFLDWKPEVSPIEGIPKLVAWVQENRALFDDPTIF